MSYGGIRKWRRLILDLFSLSFCPLFESLILPTRYCSITHRSYMTEYYNRCILKWPTFRPNTRVLHPRSRRSNRSQHQDGARSRRSCLALLRPVSPVSPARHFSLPAGSRAPPCVVGFPPPCQNTGMRPDALRDRRGRRPRIGTAPIYALGIVV
ncbi:hypothetical protein V8E52_010892 [Russula decolorans]